MIIACTPEIKKIITPDEIAVIPRPLHISEGTSKFILNPNINIISNPDTDNEAKYLKKKLKEFNNIKVQKSTSSKNGIALILNSALKNTLGEEGYKLKTSKSKITIEAATTTGIFYGIQTLLQILYPAHFDNTEAVNIGIIDKPAFKWRAFMLDEARYFKGMEVVKNLLDQMALLKMNVFHWHLVDDQGWRIEIKKYPKLTEIGSKRKASNIGGYAGEGGWSSEKYDNTPHSGYYTQEQIKEIVAYARDRHITVIPEIEMPGHCKAAIASYPWLGTTGKKIEVPVKFGAQDESYNVADPRVIGFLQDVITEVIELFPGKIIHIGGDEVRYGKWEKSKTVQKYMKEHNIKTPADLQIYFTNNMSNFINSKGYRMMGWNDILGGVHDYQNPEKNKTEQTLAKSTIIHFWKGETKLIDKAVKNGYDIVNSHHIYSYLDYRYIDLPLKKMYGFSPVPEGLDAKYRSKIIGIGCEMWGEWIPTVKDMERQIFPRIAAYAEVAWTPEENKDFEKFQKSLHNLEMIWEKEGINYKK